MFIGSINAGQIISQKNFFFNKNLFYCYLNLLQYSSITKQSNRRSIALWGDFNGWQKLVSFSILYPANGRTSNFFVYKILFSITSLGLVMLEKRFFIYNQRRELYDLMQLHLQVWNT